jgi:hypothetical protein
MMQAKRRVVLELELDEVWIFLIDGGNAMVVSSGHIYVHFLFCFNNASKTFYSCEELEKLVWEEIMAQESWSR